MKFKDLPIGTKFIVENTVLIDYFTKLNDTQYSGHNYDLSCTWSATNTDECYPLLEFLND